MCAKYFISRRQWRHYKFSVLPFKQKACHKLCVAFVRACVSAQVLVWVRVFILRTRIWFAAYEIILADKKWKSDEKLWQFCAPLLFYRILAAVVWHWHCVLASVNRLWLGNFCSLYKYLNKKNTWNRTKKTATTKLLSTSCFFCCCGCSFRERFYCCQW